MIFFWLNDNFKLKLKNKTQNKEFVNDRLIKTALWWLRMCV